MGRLKRMEDSYVPSNLNFAVDAVKGVAGFDKERNLSKTLKLGHSLKKIADILEREAQMAESDREEFVKNPKRSRGLYEKKPESETHWRGSDAIRQIAKERGAKRPESLSSTELRKHASTPSTALNLRDNETGVLANVLGHDIRVHRQYYGLPEGTPQLAKASKAPIALESGRLSDRKGMSPDQIQTDPDEEAPEARDGDLSAAGEDLSFSSSDPQRPPRGEVNRPQTSLATSHPEDPPHPQEERKRTSLTVTTPHQYGRCLSRIFRTVDWDQGEELKHEKRRGWVKRPGMKMGLSVECPSCE
ncbi:uncharacterized protein [Pempheris klunzingeri]|uniref:uncharacterized protein n=1 Tax=Pempheris klunzingeri TaxID=3127111 RepID=UPI00398137AF